MNGKNITHWQFFVAILCFLTSTLVCAEVDDFTCGSLQNAYGPYDYRTDKDKLGIVESYHFTPEVATLVRGIGGYLGGDIDYTLRAFPNHHLALMSMIQLGEREKVSKVGHAKYSVECYLHRAIRFRNDDGTVKMIYANFLVKKGRSNVALKQLNDAIPLIEDNASLNYNIGLVYLDLKYYDKSLSTAHNAYLQGFPLPGLRDRLKRAGKWRDPIPNIEPPLVPEGSER